MTIPGWSREERKMENRYYMVAILNWPVEDADDPVCIKCFPQTYEEAAAIARPWAEQGYDVVITTKEYEDEGEKKGI